MRPQPPRPDADALVIGGGPNGLAAAITLARAGRRVVLYERAARVGGGLRTEPLTLPGFLHDVCSSVYPLGAASPFLRSIDLAARGARWVEPPIAYAHPLDGADAVWASRSISDTAAALGDDRQAYRRLFEPIVASWQPFLDDILGPPRFPRRPALFASFGIDAIRSAASVAHSRFSGARARALFAGAAAHAVLPLDRAPSASVALVLGAMAHAVGWPFVAGGADRLADALADELTSLGGDIKTGAEIHSLTDNAIAGAASDAIVLCDLTPRQLLALADVRLTGAFRRLLEGYRYGPGVFKVDWALSEAIPWRAAVCRQAGTVHVGGTFAEVAESESAPWRGVAPDRPFVLVTQPTVCDPGRAPAGRHVAWGYCHVPNGSTVDMTARIEAQVERFAPGFQDVILARHTAGPAELERRNPNLVGGDIGGGAMTLGQFFTRPTWRTYRTTARNVFLCSSSTPPGGGVHGMCGYHAARTALRQI